MYVARAAALANSDFAFFVLPPDGPSRSGQEQEKSPGAARRFFRTIRAELARAADEPTNVLPRITNYPY